MRSARRSSRTSGVLRSLSGTATRFWTVNGRSAGRDSGAGGTSGTGCNVCRVAGMPLWRARTRPGSHRPGSGRSLGELGAKIGPQTARLPQTDRTDRGVLLTRRTHRGGHHPRPAQAAGRAVRAGQSLTNGVAGGRLRLVRCRLAFWRSSRTPIRSIVVR